MYQVLPPAKDLPSTKDDLVSRILKLAAELMRLNLVSYSQFWILHVIDLSSAIASWSYGVERYRPIDLAGLLLDVCAMSSETILW